MCQSNTAQNKNDSSNKQSFAQADKSSNPQSDTDRKEMDKNILPYYADAKGKQGYDLKNALSKIITQGHKKQSYHSIWQHFRKTDSKNGKVWDMYSDCEFTFGKDQDKGVRTDEACFKYNREHTFPKKWFGKDSHHAIYSDLYNIVPTDKKVNAMRGQYPFGEIKGKGDFKSSNGCRRGYPATKIPGYRGRVFEPADEYKGDFARGFFYIATRYQEKMDSWERYSDAADAVLDGSEDRVFEPWLVKLFMKWHKQDPVSSKETDRNNAIYKIQGNRNPYIDNPDWVFTIWDN